MGRHPGGASPFGVQDLVRSVWQYTSEFQDIHTRSVVLRGGSNYGSAPASLAVHVGMFGLREAERQRGREAERQRDRAAER